MSISPHIQRVVAILLFPLSIWYAVVVVVRNLLFDSGVIRSHSTSIPTIGVGNLSMGGTGKTPHSEWIIEYLLDKRLRVAFLSRGYGRKSKGFCLASADTSNAYYLGDEPAMVAKKYPKVIVAVCSSRREGLSHLQSLPQPPDVIVLDDVFQHRFVRPDLNILLTEYSNPYFRDAILPFGRLREPQRGARRADYIVVTKCPSSLSKQECSRILHHLHPRSHQQIFFSTFVYSSTRLVHPDALMSQIYELSPSTTYLLITGIARPQPLLNFLSAKQIQVKHIRFADHHNFSDSDLISIAREYKSLNANGIPILTTEKDYSRLAPLLSNSPLSPIPFAVIPIKVAFLENTPVFESLWSSSM